MTKIIFISLFTVLLVEKAFSQIQEKENIISSIRLAFEKNKFTNANREKLMSLESQIRSSEKASVFPKVTLSYTQAFDSYRPNPASLTDRYGSHDGQMSINFNIFRGFADKLRIDAKKCFLKKQTAVYDSTNSLIENTRAAIAGLVANHFVSVSAHRQNVQFVQSKIDYFNKIKAFANKDEYLTRINNALDYYRLEIEEYRTVLAMAENNFRFVVDESISDQIDNLDETISRVQVPTTFEEAFSMAELKSPDILAAELALECQVKSNEAARAERNNISLDLRIAKDRYKNNSFYGPENSNSYSGQITLSKSIGAGGNDADQAEQSLISSAKLELEGATKKIRTELDNNYLQLRSIEKAVVGYQENFIKNTKKMDELLKEIESGKPELIPFFIEVLNAYNNNWWGMDVRKREIINLRFSIQKNIGVLFEKIK